MKKLILSITLWVCVLTIGFSQVSFHILGGVSPQSGRTSTGLIVNRQSPHEEFVLHIAPSGPQYFGGVQASVELQFPFFFNAGLVYTKSKTDYLLNYTLIDAEHPVSEYVMSGFDHVLQLPVNIGVRMGAVDITSGLRLKQSLSSKTNMNQVNGFAHTPGQLQLGWQGSAGFTFSDTRLGIGYDAQFARLGSNMTINGQSLEVMHVPGQFVFTIQQKL